MRCCARPPAAWSAAGFTVPGTELTLRVERFDARPDTVGLAIGQLDALQS
jgi:hypothetical protein